ncbi:MAG: WecB/TagA/CpsF family glycosyltransferase [Chloroflexi bacterium]|nr:MAG: WecB/TagA/CpsF family glycosyltransferase [Chloroflexota bacterium]
MRVLGCPVDVVDMAAALSVLASLVDRRGVAAGTGLVVTLNPEMVMLAHCDHDFAALLDTASLLVPDGIGLVAALRRRGHAQAVRVTGVDLLLAYAPMAAEGRRRIALAGAGPGIAERAATALGRRVPGLDVVSDGGDPGPALAERLAALAPDLVCAAFGHGRQERFLAEHLAAIGAGAGIGVGGALDYLAGVVPRAPGPVRRVGLEWAWRLGRQPWRWRRQAVLPRFWWLERREARRRRNGRG